MSWIAVTIPRRASGVGMPSRCAYCFGAAEQDLSVRARREMGRSRDLFTVTAVDEYVSVGVPFCHADARRSARTRREIRTVGASVAAMLALLVLVALLWFLDAPLGVRVVFGIVAGGILGLVGLLATGLFVRRLPRYRDWGSGLLGVDLATGAEAMTFRFTNPTFAAAFRTRNGGGR